MLGYRINSHLVAGAICLIIYTETKTANAKQSSSIYGGHAFSQYGLLKWLAIRGQAEMLNLKDPVENQRQWLLNPLAGAGIILAVVNNLVWVCSSCIILLTIKSH